MDANTERISALPAASFDVAEFKRSRCYKVDDTSDTIVADMVHLRLFNRAQKKTIRTWSWVGGLGIASTVAGIVILFAQMVIPGAVVGSIGLAAAIVGFSRRVINGRLKLDERRCELVAGFLFLLSKDMATDAQINITMDFRPHNHPDKLLRRGKVRYWDASFFLDRWLEVRGRFLDGTKYSITLIEKQQDRHRKKRSASGKYKNKHKTKNTSEAIVSLKIKQKRYPRTADSPGGIQDSMKLPPWVELKSADIEGDILTLRTTTKLGWDAVSLDESPPERDGVHWIAMMFLALYRLLNDSK